MNYLKAVLQKDHEQKIKELKRLIILGEKLNKNTTPDKEKLKILLKRFKKKNKVTSKNEISNSNNSIKSVYTKENSVIIVFNKKISKDVINFFELKQPHLYRDVYDIKGNYKDAGPTKLSINSVDKITIGQFKPYVLRIVLSNKKNLPSSYIIKNNKIIINVSKSISNPNKIPLIEKTVEKKVNTINNRFIDKKNFIRLISTNKNEINIKFNGNFSKKKLKYTRYKQNKKYHNIFDIDGIYKYAKPIKLEIKGLERIIVSQHSKKLRIRLIDNTNYRIIYSIKSKQLSIKILNLNKKESTKAVPYPNYSSKVIVIDAGHGGHDVGAVGPNKRYEKVTTLKVSKYLYSILKKRGHKVYLTRNKDTFIKVMNRTILANKKNADIFISIHANAVPKSKAKKIKGIETFFLSPARSARAKRVAAKENKSDIRKMSDSTKQAFLESLNRPRITASHKLAIDVQAGLLQSVKKKYKGVHDSGVREGPFWVLVGAQMPSILVELGYMSHPIESKRLYSSKYQQLLANGIANGIDSYFSKNP